MYVINLSFLKSFYHRQQAVSNHIVYSSSNHDQFSHTKLLNNSKQINHLYRIALASQNLFLVDQSPEKLVVL